MTEQEIFEELNEDEFQSNAGDEDREEYENITNGIDPKECY